MNGHELIHKQSTLPSVYASGVGIEGKFYEQQKDDLRASTNYNNQTNIDTINSQNIYSRATSGHQGNMNEQPDVISMGSRMPLGPNTLNPQFGHAESTFGAQGVLGGPLQ